MGAAVHDPSIAAWIVVLGYACGSLCAFVAARAAGGASDRRFWLIVAVVLLFLGLNKQLDLHTLVTDLARTEARAHGWYPIRRLVQGVFLLALAAASALAAVFLALWIRRSSLTIRYAAAGVFLLMLFVLFRAASFHHLDAWIAVDLGGVRSGWWLELAGSGVVATCALLFVRRQGDAAAAAARRFGRS